MNTKPCLLAKSLMDDHTQDSVSEAEKSKQEGRKILFCLLAFFIVIATVDAYFVYKALSTHSGVVTKNAYEIGLNYNEVIAEAKRREQQENAGQ